MALLSPGVQVTVIDESDYVPSVAGTIPYVLFVTAQDKLAPDGVTIAPGTKKANAGKLYLMTSQRDIAATFGTPLFYTDSNGTPIDGDELNEYGLLASYSALGQATLLYAQRADIDLTQLQPSLSRPTAKVADQTYWFDTSKSTYGLFEWNATSQAFTAKTPTVITNTAYLVTGTSQPLQSFGNPGDYAVVATDLYNPTWYKNSSNVWVLVGSEDWSNSWAGGATYLCSPNYQAPRWANGGSAVTGSVWQENNIVNNGAQTIVKKYTAAIDLWTTQAANWYANDAAALYALDPANGGANIPVGSTYVQYDPYGVNQANFQLFERYAQGPTIITAIGASGTFGVGNSFDIGVTTAGTSSLTTSTATLTGTTVQDFLTAFNGATPTYVTATLNSRGFVTITHSQGGAIYLTNNAGDALTTAGITTACIGVTQYNVDQSGLVLSNWVTAPTFTYVAQNTLPTAVPNNNQLWYYSDATQVDIMIQNGGAWIGYQNCTLDTRGANLSQTNPTGPIISASQPLTQTDGTALELGDLWVNTSDLENYPVLYRYQSVSGINQWVLVNDTDQVSTNGILFADARWAPNGDVNPVSDPLPTIVSLLTSDYLDLDAPNPELYPEGMLLWNTRRSGYNVKAYKVDYFNAVSFPDDSLPAQTSTWLTVSGNKTNGSPYMGRQAQRSMIVKALKSTIDSSETIREESNAFTLIACPQYPELAPNMVALNNERGETAFCIVDTPLRLAPADVVTWAKNNNGLGIATQDGLLVGDAYAGAWYPSCQTTNLDGNLVVTAPSHMMLRTILNSDQQSYPWFAPAGMRRGKVDNAIQLGYINTTSSKFQPLTVSQGLRDALYTNRIDPLTFIPGSGILNYGNKTTTGITSALDRINVARLVAYMRGKLKAIAEQYLFEPNDQITRNSVTNAINGLMIDLIAKRAIYDYLVVCDLSNNTPARIDRNELWIDIAIEPVKAIEFIYIPVRIKNTGAIAAGI